MASRSTRILALPHIIPPCSCRSSLRLSRRVVNLPTSTASLRASARHSPSSPTFSIPLSFHSRSLASHAPTAVVSPKAGPTKAYEDQITAGLIQPDDHQRSIITLLQDMYDSLETYSPPEIPEPLAVPAPTFFSKLFASTPTSSVPTIPPNVPKGLYLYGSVGCGKSYLMDLFYANLPAKWNGNKRRVHFHAFMMDVHLRGHRMKSEMEGDERDWIVHAARELAGEARILCFDEFQVGRWIRRRVTVEGETGVDHTSCLLGYRHSRCYDFTATYGILDGLRSCGSHDLQVGLISLSLRRAKLLQR